VSAAAKAAIANAIIAVVESRADIGETRCSTREGRPTDYRFSAATPKAGTIVLQPHGIGCNILFEVVVPPAPDGTDRPKNKRRAFARRLFSSAAGPNPAASIAISYPGNCAACGCATDA
jgi:hypothetical protein